MNFKYVFLLFVMLFLVACGDGPIERYNKWKLEWEDNFNSNVLNKKYWSKTKRQMPDWSNYMTDNDTCVTFRDGKLILRGIKNDFILQDTARYLTGGIYTKGKKTFEYGKIAIRAKLNAAQGAWPALWMMAEAPEWTWPDGCEIDIMERVNYSNIVHQTVHSFYTGKLGIKDNPPHSGKNNFDTEGFNIFSVEIYPDSLVFAVNNIHTFTYPKIHTEKKHQYPFGVPSYLILSMQLGGVWVGQVKEQDLPVEMEIDWVKYYKLIR